MSIVGRIVARTGLTPNMITVIGLLLNLIVAVVIASGNLIISGILVLLAGAFDVVDGAVARATNQVSKFGGFFDSSIDRYADAIVLGGVMVYFLREDAYFRGDDVTALAVVLTYITLVGSFMISYTRSKAEALGLQGDVGFAQRAERVIVLAIALLFNQPFLGIVILAILTHATVVQRGYHVWRSLRSQDLEH